MRSAAVVVLLALTACEAAGDTASLSAVDAEARVSGLRTIPQPPQVMAFGGFTASVGDLDGDGLPELAASALRYPPLSPIPFGVVLLLPGDPALPVTTLSSPFRTTPDFGQPSSTAGDVNDDGYPDLLVGDPEPPGQVVLYLGGPPDRPPQWGSRDRTARTRRSATVSRRSATSTAMGTTT